MMLPRDLLGGDVKGDRPLCLIREALGRLKQESDSDTIDEYESLSEHSRRSAGDMLLTDRPAPPFHGSV